MDNPTTTIPAEPATTPPSPHAISERPALPAQGIKPEPEPDPVMEAFRHELRTYVDKPLTAKSLRQIMQIAEAGREILAVRNPRVKRRRGGIRRAGSVQYMGSNPGFGYDCDYDEWEDEDEDGAVPGGGIGIQASQGRMNLDRETFGARILREIVAVIPQVLRASREDQAQIVQAIAAAEKEGMPELANDLRAKLMVPTSATQPTRASGNGASQPADARTQAEHAYMQREDSIWAAKLPDSDEYIVGPAPLGVVCSLATAEHEIVNTETGRSVSPEVLAALVGTGACSMPEGATV